MSKLPIITARELIRILEKKGYYKDRQVGSHVIMVHHLTDKTISAPAHKGKTLGKGITIAILKDS